jgi:hypothetical protein
VNILLPRISYGQLTFRTFSSNGITSIPSTTTIEANEKSAKELLNSFSLEKSETLKYLQTFSQFNGQILFDVDKETLVNSIVKWNDTHFTNEDVVLTLQVLHKLGFTFNATKDRTILKQISSKFFIREVEDELTNPLLNIEFLKILHQLNFTEQWTNFHETEKWRVILNDILKFPLSYDSFVEVLDLFVACFFNPDSHFNRHLLYEKILKHSDEILLKQNTKVLFHLGFLFCFYSDYPGRIQQLVINLFRSNVENILKNENNDERNSKFAEFIHHIGKCHYQDFNIPFTDEFDSVFSIIDERWDQFTFPQKTLIVRGFRNLSYQKIYFPSKLFEKFEKELIECEKRIDSVFNGNEFNVSLYKDIFSYYRCILYFAREPTLEEQVTPFLEKLFFKMIENKSFFQKEFAWIFLRSFKKMSLMHKFVPSFPEKEQKLIYQQLEELLSEEYYHRNSFHRDSPVPVENNNSIGDASLLDLAYM